jgi:putative ABC transport system substrate-binding protein
MLRRRHILGAIAAIGAGAAIWRGTAFAQAVVQRKLVGYLNGGSADASIVASMLQGEFARLGWKEGENLQFEVRHANHQPERIAALARELVAMNPALLLGLTTEVILALRQASERVPIVAINITNPVQHGLAASLGRPGGNVTGLVSMGSDFFPKLIEYARIVAPRARRVGFLFNPANRVTSSATAQEGRRVVGAARGFEFVEFPVRDAQDIEKAIRSMTPAGDYVLLPAVEQLLAQNLARIADLALAARLPSVSANVDWSSLGGLLTYGPDWRDNVKRAAQLADQILRGAKPADMPIEQPRRIPLVVNQRTARAIGVKIPNELLVRADEIIE